MDNYIRCYENAVTNELCDNTVTKFESSYFEEHERHDLKTNHSFLSNKFTKKWLWNGEISYLKDVFETVYQDI